MRPHVNRRVFRIVAMVCAAGAFFWLVIHLELSNWDEPIPGSRAAVPSHAAQVPAPGAPGSFAHNEISHPRLRKPTSAAR